MNKSVAEARAFVTAVQGKLPAPDKVETAIAAPALFLETMLEANVDQVLRIAAETCYYEDEGAYTGEISPKALRQMAIPYVIVGHSERRRYFNETDDVINRKVHAVFRNGMTPIICCDETMGRRVPARRFIGWSTKSARPSRESQPKMLRAWSSLTNPAGRLAVAHGRLPTRPKKAAI